jgi:Uma2 family endonuclease
LHASDLVYDVGKEKDMETEVTKRLFTVDEFYRMADAGIFTEDDRVELIDGEILEMSPIGLRHSACVNRATTFFSEAFGRSAIVSIQNPLWLSEYTEPLPDIIVLRPVPDFYASRKCRPDDVLFMVEVSDTTLNYDKNIKLPRYAMAGVAEFWIEDLKGDVLLVYRDPVGKSFTTSLVLQRGDSISPLAFPKVTFQVNDLLG